MNRLNVWMALTNLVAFFPMRTSYQQQNMFLFGIITFAAGTSFVSHLFESHKHGMTGFGCSHEVSYYLNRLDFFGVCLLVFNILLTSNFKSLVEITPLGIICFSLNLISEYDKSAESRSFFIIIHSFWHFAAFLALDYFLQIRK